MKTGMIVRLSMAALWGLNGGAAMGKLTLVQNGQPVATIVVAREPTKSAAFAAVELQAHVQKITGAMLPIVRDDQTVTGTRILVGESAATAALGYTNAGFAPQEYVVDFQDRTLVLMGRDKEDRIDLNSIASYGSPFWITNGACGNALAFNGSNAVYVLNSGLTPAQGTVETWVRIHDINNQGNILGINWNDSYFSIQPRNDGDGLRVQICFVNGGELYGHIRSGLLAKGRWHHVAATYNAAAGKIELFVNGVSQGQSAYAAPSGPAVIPLKIGGNWTGTNVVNGYAGCVDEVRVSSCVRDGGTTYTNQLTQPPGADVYTTLLMHLNSTSGVPVAEYLPHLLNLKNALLPDWYDDQATCYAAYDFLERYCGVRWLNPTEYGTVCSNAATLSVTGPNVRRAPFFKMRGVGTPLWGGSQYDAGVETLWPYGTAGFTQYVAAAYPGAFAGCGSQAEFDAVRARCAQLFLHRMRAGGERNECGHSLNWYNRFKDSHPAWFAQGWPITNDYLTQLCYANTGVIAQAAADARDYYDGRKTGAALDIPMGGLQLPNEFPITPMDCSRFCTCTNCLAWVNRDTFGFGSTSIHSDYVFNFVNQAAAALQTTHPGKRIMSLAYGTYAVLPTRLSVNTNVDVQYCFAYSQWPSAPAQYNHELDNLRAWGSESLRTGRKLYFWLYNTWWSFASESFYQNNYRCFPPYLAHTVANQFALFSTNNYRGMFYCGWGPEVDAYVSYQLMNDPSQNIETMLDGYFNRMYGPAAGPMKNIYLTIENAFSSPSNSPPEGVPVPNKAIDWGWRGTAERMASLSNLMAQAVSLAGASNAYAANVNLFKIGTWDYMVAGRQDFVQTCIPPTVILTSPTNGAMSNASVTLTATAASDNMVIIGAGSDRVSTGQWHHVLATHDTATGKMELFVDGMLQSTRPYLPAGGRNTELRIGGNWTGTNVVNGYVGYVDEVRVSSCVRNGWAAYTNQLTQPPGADAYTTLLLHFDNPSNEMVAVGATIFGAPLNPIAGKHNSALAFNADTVISLPNGAFSDEVGTWEAWVYLREGSCGNILGTYGGQFYQLLQPSAGGGLQYVVVTAGLNVKFYADGTPIGTGSSYPFTCTWTNALSGSHILTAKATDIYNLSTISVPVNIIINDSAANKTTRPLYTLTKDGTPAAAIVLSETPSRIARFAAAELQWHVRKITGATLPVLSNAAAIPAGHLGIFVGDTPEARAAGLTQDQFKPQEYVIRAVPGKLLLVGLDKPDTGAITYSPEHPAANANLPDFYDAQGSVHAVYDFLEKSCDVRWFDPTDNGMTCPETRTLTVKAGDLRRVPFFRYRGAMSAQGEYPGAYDAYISLWPQSSDGLKEYQAAAYARLKAESPQGGEFVTAKCEQNRLFLLRMRMGGEPTLCNHSFDYFYDRFWEQNPDPVRAKRFVAKKPQLFAQGHEGRPPQLCYTSTQLIQQVAQDARDYYDGKKTGAELGIAWNPRLPNPFPIEPMDNSLFCRCLECQAWFEKGEKSHPGYSQGTYSDYFFNFVNEVAKELHKTHPDKPITCLSYGTHAYPPKRITLDPSVLVQFCFACNRIPWCPQEYGNDLRAFDEWATVRKGQPLYLWLYPNVPVETANNGKFYCFPGFFAHTIDKQFKRFAQAGVRGMFFCGFGQEVEAYVTFKLMDDPKLDVDMLLDEYFGRLYGAAAKPMKKLYLAIEETYSNPKNYPEPIASGKTSSSQTPDLAWQWLGTEARMGQFAALMQQARDLARTELEKRRVAVFEKATWNYMLAGRQSFTTRMSAPIPALKAPQIEKAGGDLAKVAWTNAAAMPGSWFDRGSDKPAARRLSGRAAHDGEYLYLELVDLCDTKKLTITSGVFCYDDWEVFVAAQRAQPFRQYAVGPSAQLVVFSYGEVNWQQGVPVLEHGAKAGSDVAAPDKWMTRLAIPLKSVLPGGAVPGAKLYMNVIRVTGPNITGNGNVGVDTWVSYCTAREIDRLAEITLE